jgi:hypothetical protein
MRAFVFLVLVPLTVLASRPRTVVLLQSPPGLQKIVTKALGNRFEFLPTEIELSETPTAKEVRALSVPAKACALMLVQPGRKFITVQVLNGNDGVPLDTVSIPIVPKQPLKQLPKDALQSIVAALSAGVAPKKTVELGDQVSEVVPLNSEGPSANNTMPEKLEQPQTKATDEVETENDAPISSQEQTAVPADSQHAQTPSSAASNETEESEKQVPSEAAQASESKEPASNETPPEPLVVMRVAFGVVGLNRTFNWGSGPDTLAAYSLAFAPTISADAQWFPAAPFTTSFGANIGVYGRADIGIGLFSTQNNAAGTQSVFATQANRLRVGGLLRFPIGKHEINVHVGFSTHRFSIARFAANTGTPRPNIPSVDFSGARFGTGGRLRLGPISLELGAALLPVSDSGELSSLKYFPIATAFGIDANVGISVALVEHIHVRLGAEWTRYFLTLGLEKTASNESSDQYLSLGLSLVWTM